jgi:hypothetical protein
MNTDTTGGWPDAGPKGGVARGHRDRSDEHRNDLVVFV